VLAASNIRALMEATALMTEAASTPEMLVNFYQTTWRNISKDSHFLTSTLFTILKNKDEIQSVLPCSEKQVYSNHGI
jgi:hypothetical protein